MKNISKTIKYLLIFLMTFVVINGVSAYDDYYTSYDAYDDYYTSYDAYDDYYTSYDPYNDYYECYDCYDDYYGYDDYCYDCYGGIDIEYYVGYDYGYYGNPFDYSYEPGYVYYDNNGGCTNCGGNNPPRRDDLDVECRVSDSTIEEGDDVTFTAYVDGGDSPYDYEWDGDADGSSRSISERFNDEGRYSVTVTVRDDDGNRASDTCYVEVENENDDDFDVTCRMSPNNPEEGERIRFEADVEGGNSPYDYDWSRDVDGDDRIIYEEFNRDGDYEARITVTDDDGNRVSDTCEFEVDNDNESNVSVTSTTGLSNPDLGTPAVSAVYLSQVPYTGPGDTLVLMLWIVAGIMLSAGIVMKTRKSSYRKQVQNRIAEFKEMNKRTV